MELSASQIKLLSIAADVSGRLKIPIFVVGGLIRDLLQLPSAIDRDLDLVVEGDAREAARESNRLCAGELKDFPAFLTCKIVNPANLGGIDEIDFASARSEIYERPGALPRVTPAKIADDLRRRDFSINAMAVPVERLLSLSVQECDGNARRESEGHENCSLDLSALRRDIFDPLNGLVDLDAKTVRVLHDQSFIDDPTRLFRALRYCHRLGFSMDADTQQQFKRAVGSEALRTISIVRALNEMRKACAEPDWAGLLRRFADQDLLRQAQIVAEGSQEKFIYRLIETSEGGKVTAVIDRQLIALSLAISTWDKGDRARVLRRFQLGKKLSGMILDRIR